MAERSYATALDILADAQEIVPLSTNMGNLKVAYAMRPSPAAWSQFYDESVADEKDARIKEFQQTWELCEDESGIRGSSLYLGARFDQRALRHRGLWLPDRSEGKKLEYNDKLTNDVYRDYGLFLGNTNNYNLWLATKLIEQAKAADLLFPLFIPFRAMQYDVNDPFIISLTEHPQGVIQGNQAEQILITTLDTNEVSGVQRLNRGGDGDWDSYWNSLASSNFYGRVDWICGEADESVLVRAHEALLERKYSEKMEEERIEFRRQLDRI